MKKNSIITGLLFFISEIAVGQSYKGQLDLSKLPVPSQHYEQEYTFDTPLNPDAWHSQQAGLHVSFASTDELFFRTEVPTLEKETTSWEATGWKGERINAQILVWSPDSLQQVRFRVSDLKSSTGKLISKKYVQVNMILYVASNYPYGDIDATC